MTEVPTMAEPADDYAERERVYREEGFRHTALNQAAQVAHGVAASGRAVPVVAVLELADYFAAYLRDGTIPPRATGPEV